MAGFFDWILNNPLDALEGATKIYGAVKSSNAASDAADASQALTNAQIERNDAIYELYADGGKLLRDNIQRLLTEYGDFGQVTPDIVNANQEYFATQRANQEAANRNTVNNMTKIDEMRLKGYEDAFRDFAANQLTDARSAVYAADQVGKDEAPDTLDFARLQDSLAVKFMALRNQDTQRSLNNQYAKATAGLPPGMENSTLRVQMERSMADLSAQKFNENMMAAIGDAQNYISGLQTAASNQQNMTNAERNMQRNLTTDTLNYGSTTLGNSLKGGAYGQAFAGEINAQRGRAVAELDALLGLRNDTAMRDFLNGLSTTAAENKLANDYITQVSQITTAPYTYTASGQNSVNYGGAIDSLSSIASASASLAAGNTKALGDWWTTMRTNNNW